MDGGEKAGRGRKFLHWGFVRGGPAWPRPLGEAMCGICGIYNFDRDETVRPEVLQAMNQQLLHRGPDDEGRYIAQNVGLAMRRLSIVDLKSGHQPLSNEDGTVWIVFNGEIYNHA